MDHCRCGLWARWCARADALFNSEGMHVLDVRRGHRKLVIMVETDVDVTAAFACYNGTAPVEVSSGDVVRHRLSRAGDRQLNHALHIMAITHLAGDTAGRAYYRRKRAAGKSHKEALRCLKRRLSDVVYRQLVHDAATDVAAGLGGQQGAAVESSAAG